MNLITDEMRAAIGRVFEQRVSFPITPSDIRRWAIAVYHPDVPPDTFWSGSTTVEVPEEFNPFAWMAHEPRGLPRRLDAAAINAIEDALGIPAPRLKIGVNGGIEVEYGERMRPKDVITSSVSLYSYDEKEGSSGPLLVTRTLDLWTNQLGKIVKRTTLTYLRYGRVV